MGSRLLSFFCSSYDSRQVDLSNMEAIKKKMQAMKIEKDNACDRVDESEEKCRAARLRASKAEDEVDELVTKSRQLETELTSPLRSWASPPSSWRRRRSSSLPPSSRWRR